MKDIIKIQGKNQILMAQELVKVNKKMKELEKRQKELKNHFLDKLKNGKFITDGVEMTIYDGSRNVFDKEAFIASYSEGIYEEFLNITTYRAIKAKAV